MLSLPIKRLESTFDHNIEMLAHRKRGDLYTSRNGRLKRLSLMQKIVFIASKYINQSHFKRIQSEVKETIDWTVNHINDDNKDELLRLFYRKLAPLSENVFDRSQIGSHIQAVLKAALRDVTFDPRKEHKYSRFNEELLEAQFATYLGVRPIRPGIGNSESYILRDIKGRKVGIFKTSTGDSLSTKTPFLPLRLRNKLLKLIGFGGSIFRHVAGSCHVAEVASYKMAKRVDAKSIPQTKIVVLDPLRYKRKLSRLQKGSFQLFEQGAIEAKEFLGVHKRYQEALDSKKHRFRVKNDFPVELAEDLIINDVVEGNMDRHAENWLVKAKDFIAKSIVLIDGGIAFSPTHADSIFEKGKLYLWATPRLKFAQSRFSQKAKKRIKSMYENRKKLKEDLYKLYVFQGDEAHIANKRAKRMGERIEMLYWFSCIKDFRKYKLRDYKTSKQITRALKDLQRHEKTSKAVSA